MPDQPQRQQAHCNACGGHRNHDQISFHQETWEENTEEDGRKIPIADGWDTYTLLKCSGCDAIRLKHESWFSHSPDDETSVTYYPPALSRNLPTWLSGMESLRFMMSQTFVPTLLKQIYSAYHSGGHALAAMGIRALVEQMMIDKIGDRGAFAVNLKEFEKAGYISKVQREFLEKTIELGHAAIHRGHQPSPEDIRRSLDIAEPILETIYIHEGHATHLETSTPKRNQKS
jgi:hypothetical protein